MATVHYAALLAVVLLLRFHSATANFTLPFLSPLLGDDPCRADVCGKGNCVASNNSNFGFECRCNKGWKQVASDDEALKFLPCIVPNCSMNFHCAQAPAPASKNQDKHNFSIFDPCSWTDCGGGSCNKTSVFTHTCLCEVGYYNLFNSTAFPCYKECAVGADCASIGLNMYNSSTSGPQPSSTVVNDNSHASRLIPRGESGWLIIMASTFALFCVHFA